MKCITILQPWASLVITGHKVYETRSWATRHRGPLLIHASKTLNDYQISLMRQEPFRSALLISGYKVDPCNLPVGMILGGVMLTDCQSSGDLLLAGKINKMEASFGDYGPGRYGWELTTPTPLVVPIPFRGQLGIYDVPDATLNGNFLSFHTASLRGCPTS